MPSKEFPDDASWQVLENGLMKPEDYDMVLSEGFAAFQKHFMETRFKVNPNVKLYLGL